MYRKSCLPSRHHQLVPTAFTQLVSTISMHRKGFYKMQGTGAAYFYVQMHTAEKTLGLAMQANQNYFGEISETQ